MKRILVSSALLMAVLGCEAPQTLLVDAGESQVTVEGASTADAPVDGSKVVCDPFQNRNDYVGAGRGHGIVGKLGYLPSGSAAARAYSEFERNGIWLDADLFISDLNVPTRKFDLGFVNQYGDLLLDQDGDRLYENFAVNLESQIVLSDAEAEGDYQFAVLSDDGSIFEIDRGQGFETLINNDGLTATRLRGSTTRVDMKQGQPIPMRLKYFQGPRYHIAFVLLWRPYPKAGGFPAQDVRFGQSGNSLWFDFNFVPSVPQGPYMELLNRGWKPVPPKNFILPAAVAKNPCVPAEPLPRVALQCAGGSYAPKSEVRLGLAINSSDASAANIIAQIQSMGLTPTVYSPDDVATRRPQSDGINTLIISRVAVVAPIAAEFSNSIREFAFAGGSLISEYDGAALAFTQQDTSSGVPVMGNINPSFGLFEGIAAGGGALLPLESSRTYITDSAHPLMAGMPANFLAGVRTAFAFSQYDENWLGVQAQFTSTGYNNLVPAGTYPAVLSGRCGSGRVVLYSMNYFQVLSQAPVQTLLRNSLGWATGNP